MVINRHGFQEAHLKLLSVSAELGCETVPLGLEFLLADVKSLEVLELLFDLYDLLVLVLIVFDHLIDGDLVLSNQDLALVSLGFSFTAIPLVFKRHIDHVFFFREGVSITRSSLVSVCLGQILQ